MQIGLWALKSSKKSFLPSPTFPFETIVEWFDFFDEAREHVLDGEV
jgi:hypothetical protein